MKTIQMQVKWSDSELAVISAIVHAVKAKAGKISALRKYQEGKPKAKMGGFNSAIGKIRDKANLVLNGGTVQVKFKDELGNVVDELSEEHIYTADSDAENRKMAETFLVLATNFYTKPQRGRKSKSTSDLAQLFKSALAEMEAEEAEEESDESEVEAEELETANA